MASDKTAILEVGKSNEDFSRNLLRVLESFKGNLICSPLSAHLILALAHLGAKGATAAEMVTGLNLPSDRETTKAGFKALMTTLQDDKEVVLKIANRMYVKNSFEVADEFMKDAVEAFNSSVARVEFTDPTTVKKINSWVEEITNNKIKDLISPDMLDDLTRMVLINAVYFKGKWASPFKPDRTEPMPFFIDQTNSIEIPFMNQKAHYGYANDEDLKAQIIELPYQGNQLSLVVVLPNERTGLAELEKKMHDRRLSDVMKNVRSREIELYMPKFKLEVTIPLNSYLSQLGMSHMFSDGADFSGISENVPLKVSHVIQKAFIEVSEEGTEAAAATAVIMAAYCMVRPIEVLKVFLDHPFVFYLITKTEDESVLFAGRLVQP